MSAFLDRLAVTGTNARTKGDIMTFWPQTTKHVQLGPRKCFFLIKVQMNDPNEFPSLYTDLHTKLAYTEISLQSDNRSFKDKEINKK